MANKTEHEALRDTILNSLSDGFDHFGNGQFAALPDGFELHNLEGFQTQPDRIRAHPKFVSARSFAEYLTRFATDSMMITASTDKAEMYAVIDYHGDDPAAPGQTPSHCEHKATYKARLTDKIKAWLGMCDRPLGQVEFGLFLEERAIDVIQPAAAEIMEMVMTFEATKKVEFKSSTRLADGSRQFTYVEDNQSKGGVTLPDRIVIRAAIYEGMEPQDITFLLRYRINDGALRFQIKMHNHDEVLAEAFARCVDGVMHDVTPEQAVYWVE